MRISRLRIAALWLLLLPMALVVVPRHALHHCVVDAQNGIHWHDAAHEHSVGDEDRQADGAQVQANCPICELQVVLDVPPTPVTLGWVEGFVCDLPVQRTSAPLAAPCHLLPNRGPPALG